MDIVFEVIKNGCAQGQVESANTTRIVDCLDAKQKVDKEHGSTHYGASILLILRKSISSLCKECRFEYFLAELLNYDRVDVPVCKEYALRESSRLPVLLLLRRVETCSSAGARLQRLRKADLVSQRRRRPDNGSNTFT